MIRRTLDGLYLWSGYVAAAFLAAIAGTIILQVIGRRVGFTVDATEIAGFCMAASTFFALAHTFKRGSHVRVTLLLARLGGRPRGLLEAVCCIAAAVVVGYAGYHALLLALQSYTFGDISPGLLAIPFWIPQAGMALGLLLLLVALLDEAVSVLLGAPPSGEVRESPGSAENS